MKSAIKIIKRKPDEEPNLEKDSESRKSSEPNTREMVTTVKSWISELQQRKRDQRISFSPLPLISAAPANQNS